jgi:hypothetical protein
VKSTAGANLITRLAFENRLKWARRCTIIVQGTALPVGSIAIRAAAAEGSSRLWEKDFLVDAAGPLFRMNDDKSTIPRSPRSRDDR